MNWFIAFLVLIGSSIALCAEEVVGVEPGFFTKIPFYFEVLSQAIFSLAVLATIVVRVIPGKKDDEELNKALARVRKYMGYLPTFGINPRTKALEEALADVKKQNEEKK